MKDTHAFPSLAQVQRLPSLLSHKERIIFLGGSALFLLGIFFLCIGSFFTFFTTVPRQGGTLTEGMLGYPQLINPLYADANTVDRELSALIYSGLVTYDASTQVFAPDLAESLTVSEDEKVYTLTLRQDIAWQDGEPFAARDVLFTFSALQNPAYGSPLIEAYRNITLAQPDEHTLTFTLPEPYAAFTELLSIGILPAHLWEEVTPSNARFVALNLKPVGTGTYILEKTSKDSRGSIRSITLTSSATSSRKQPYIDEIVVKFYTSSADIIQAIQTKRIDSTGALSLAEVRTLRDDTSLSVTALPLAQYVGAFFNTKKDLLTDVSLRKALAFAIDIPGLTAHATQDLGIPLGFTLPGFPANTAMVQDTSSAAALLDELGWVRNESGIRVKNGKELTLAIISAERPELAQSAEYIAEMWRNMGIVVTVRALSTPEMSTELKEKNYDVLIAAEQYGVIADPYSFWHSSGKGSDGLNMSQFSTTATDTAVSTLRTALAPEKRLEAYTTLTNAFIENVPAVFLFQNTLPLMHTVDILGISSQPIPHATARWTLESSWYKRTGISWRF